MSKTYNVPSIEKLAAAFAYIEAEFCLDSGIVERHMWAEGLARGANQEIDCRDLAVARDALTQLSAPMWAEIVYAARLVEGQSLAERLAYWKQPGPLPTA